MTPHPGPSTRFARVLLVVVLVIAAIALWLIVSELLDRPAQTNSIEVIWPPL